MVSYVKSLNLLLKIKIFFKGVWGVYSTNMVVVVVRCSAAPIYFPIMSKKILHSSEREKLVFMWPTFPHDFLFREKPLQYSTHVHFFVKEEADLKFNQLKME